ncbi:MAG: magnesium protoporphyrin IX methyltransferase [Pseudomonadota bacterium]
MAHANPHKPSYAATRERLRDYFDRTAMETWARLTSDAPVSRIRETVRRGRDEMRATLLSWLPEPLEGARLLDAGCGAGQLSIAAAERGAEVVGVDIAPQLVSVAASRAPSQLIASGRLRLLSGDMLDPDLGAFDHVVAMDSLIHYGGPDILDALAGLAQRTRRSILFTVAPKTPALTAMHWVGRAFPRADRAPAIVPIRATRLLEAVAADPRFADWRAGRTHRVSSGFYMSAAIELVRSDPDGTNAPPAEDRR